METWGQLEQILDLELGGWVVPFCRPAKTVRQLSHSVAKKGALAKSPLPLPEDDDGVSGGVRGSRVLSRA